MLDALLVNDLKLGKDGLFFMALIMQYRRTDKITLGKMLFLGLFELFIVFLLIPALKIWFKINISHFYLNVKRNAKKK